ncbi:MAG: lysylphosphatidylglycerol synthase transmembrane domain-containing protein [Alphaproteobacteria bacterium]|nr:lysylphosphatidylglycerol synthase transmembrane domain-containing protein [Alphaproteobacteria bacterium]
MITVTNVKVWRWVGVAAGLLLLAWVLRDFDLSRFRRAVAAAHIWPLFLLPVATVAEQLLRALKWRQMLYPLRPVRVWRLFGAIMAGYLANLAAPVRVSPFVRAWLIARLEGLSASTVLATVALDRLIDGLVFVGFTATASSGKGLPGVRYSTWRCFPV